MTAPELGFHHRFIPGAPDRPVLLLLHGTGGDENDLLPLGEALLPGAARLSPRGQVLENGMPRFFRRLAEGVFDLDDLRRRTHELADFVEAAAEVYQFGERRPVAVVKACALCGKTAKWKEPTTRRRQKQEQLLRTTGFTWRSSLKNLAILKYRLRVTVMAPFAI